MYTTAATYGTEQDRMIFGEKSDHLGNVRAVVSDIRKPTTTTGDIDDWTWQADITDHFSYYPFGMLEPGRQKRLNTVDAGGYRFGFGNHEKIDEVSGSGNTVDMGDRWLDVRLGRTPKPDASFALYPGVSPYAYALNTPINAVDPDGKVVIFVNGYRGGSAAWKDFNDPVGIRRSVRRLFTSEKLYKTDKFKYWGSTDNKFMKRIGDYNAVYADASSHAFSTASYRYNRGKEAGEAMLKKIDAGEIKLQTDENGNVTETIKIVSHSQGSSYASGMSKVLTDAGYKVEVEYNIAPKQPGDIPETEADRRVQYGSDQDLIAPQSPMPEDVEQGGPPEKEGPVEGHMLENFKNIFNIKKGQEGYVAPRKDVQENGGGIFGIIMLIMIFLGGCKNKEEQLKCLEEQITKYKEDQGYRDLKIAATDSIKKWTQQGLKYTTSYRDTNSTWKVDEIIFNKDKSKLLGWILKVDKDSLYKPIDEADKDFLYPDDHVNYFAGEKINGRWFFYIHHMPGIWFDRENNNGQPYSFEYLSERAKAKVVEGGVFKKCTCDMNDSYINEWIDREDREMYKWHQEFLESGDKE